MSEENKVEKWCIKNLISEKNNFYIPSYQRGYRWKKKQVDALINDFLEFVGSGEKEYCLQPITLKPYKKDGVIEENGFILVDGQQRITTLLLIANALKIEKINARLIDLEKEKEIDLKNVEGSDINATFRKGTKECVEARPVDEREKLKKIFEEDNKKNVVVIKYILNDKENENDAFERINSGKIPLTSAELLRARFMTSPKIDENKKMEIAKEWELIESTLSNQDFWAMLYTNKHYQSVRIDLLFSTIAGISLDKIKVDPLATFYKLESRIKDCPEEMWREILECFWFLQSCYNDIELYNYFSFISTFTQNQLSTVYEWFKDSNSNFKEFKETTFPKKIKELNWNSHTKLDDFVYEKGNVSVLRQLFVLLNVLHCNTQKQRFNFDAFKDKENGWDIEHINPQTENQLTDVKQQKEWITAIENLLTKEEKTEFDGKESFEDKYEMIVKNEKYGGGLPNNKNDSFYNLTLLDSATNRSYGNSIFPVKRRLILENMQERYILPCTLNVFTKFYSKKATALDKWDEDSAKAYQEAMKDLAKGFFE